MKRSQLIETLVKEGFSEKTLANFTDKQITVLSERIIGEQPVSAKGSVVMKKGSNPLDVKKITDSGMNVELREKLIGNQKKLDKNHNGKIDAQDFKILKGQKKKEEKPSDDSSKEKNEVNEWIDSLVENNYHSFTSKNEIMELIQVKLNENNPSPSQPKPDAPVREKPTTKPGKPKRENPFEPKHTPKPKALSEEGNDNEKLPEFLKFKKLGIKFKDSN